ncbi:alpha-ketoglutarate-dependent taurine dioxygenase protein [Apiospora aurea]|uniref:Alpha-ketoglutarate-dependent taurine dioxygenase protein n=1 Tax=Apiospora aurea TaxID=335848 RepID=A0ABR1QGP3_9PEZI
MAPSATSTVTVTEPVSHFGAYKELQPPKYNKDVEEGGAAYPHYLPTWDASTKYPPLEPFEHYEHGKDADSTYPDLLNPAGTEVRGVQLSTLTPAGKDQLARLVAERKVVAFRDQDFKDLPIQSALDWGGYFGRHHIHPASGAPAGYAEVHLVHRGEGDESSKQFYASRTSSVAWHSDVSYEEQPPGTTFLYIFDKPETGGDTLFANTVEAYNRLSPLFQERLHGLQATHSGFEQAAASLARGGIVRREPVANVHPIVRTHPATGEKSLYVNPQFTREIVGMKKEESDAILNFLYSHIAWGADFHVRVKWEQGTVVVWDNRVTQHSALVDWENKQRRHLARITPQAERPYETPFQG